MTTSALSLKFHSGRFSVGSVLEEPASLGGEVIQDDLVQILGFSPCRTPHFAHRPFSFVPSFVEGKPISSKAPSKKPWYHLPAEIRNLIIDTAEWL